MNGRHAAVVALIVANLVVRPASISASTGSEPPLPACTFAVPVAFTGSPVEISGPIPVAGSSVEIEADRPDKRVREASVTTGEGVWRAVLLFDAVDAGAWTIRVSSDGGPACESPMTVVTATSTMTRRITVSPV